MDKLRLHKYTQYFLEGKLSEEKEIELLNWIKHSDENKAIFLQEQTRIEQLVISKKDIRVAQNWNLIKKRIQAAGSSNVRGLYLKIASIAAAFVFGIVFTITVKDYDNLFGYSSAEIQNISVPYGAKTNIKLPDGSLVWLNAGSTLSYPSKFSKTREVSLDGEAFFEVEHNDKPFVVETKFGDVEVKGTSFDVKAFGDENLQTTLVTGSVVFREKVNGKEVTLKPGEQANLEGTQIEVRKVDTEIFTSWKEGKLIFNNEYLPAVIKRLERWYNVKIILDDDKRLERIKYNGTLEMETFSEVLGLLKVTSPVDYSYNEKTRTIRIFYKKNNKGIKKVLMNKNKI